jgi:hypothetical protein
VIFNNYGQELLQIEQMYEKLKQNPPISRNMPPVSDDVSDKRWCGLVVCDTIWGCGVDVGGN